MEESEFERRGSGFSLVSFLGVNFGLSAFSSSSSSWVKSQDGKGSSSVTPLILAICRSKEGVKPVIKFDISISLQL